MTLDLVVSMSDKNDYENCSFCAKHKDDVRKLIVGNGVAICNECVDLCQSLLTDGEGGPLSIVIAPANVNDHKLLERTLDSIVIERPEPSTANPQHLCLDKAYDNRQSREIVKKHRYKDHIRRIGEEKIDQKGKKKHPARRYVVERTLAWLSKCRGFGMCQ